MIHKPCLKGALKLHFNTFDWSGITLKKPQMPPPVLMSADTLGSSCSSGKVIEDPVSNPPVMAGCWTMGLDTTPGRFKATGLKKTQHYICNVSTFNYFNYRNIWTEPTEGPVAHLQ